MKAGASLWRSLGWVPNADRDGTKFGSALSGPIAELQADHLMRLYQLTENVLKSAAGMQTEAALEPARGGDRRFNDTEWRDNSLHRLLKQCYLLNSRYCTDFVEALDLDEKEKHRLRFFTRQLVEAMSPTNFLATNPDVIKLATETEGQSFKAAGDSDQKVPVAQEASIASNDLLTVAELPTIRAQHDHHLAHGKELAAMMLGGRSNRKGLES
jgi:polyhydroxyalkanoate synthase